MNPYIHEKTHEIEREIRRNQPIFVTEHPQRLPASPRKAAARAARVLQRLGTNLESWSREGP